MPFLLTHHSRGRLELFLEPLCNPPPPPQTAAHRQLLGAEPPESPLGCVCVGGCYFSILLAFQGFNCIVVPNEENIDIKLGMVVSHAFNPRWVGVKASSVGSRPA